MSISENILYELLNTAEWPAHPQNPDGSCENNGSLFQHGQWTSIKKSLSAAHTVIKRLIPFPSRVTPQLASVVDGSSEWKVSSCRAGGGVVAVLQDAHLEIRHSNHNYADIIARSDTLLADPFPRWRQLSWSSDGTLLAVAYSNGVVQLYTTLAQLLYTIYPPRFKEGAVYFEPNRALALLVITDDLIKDTKWLCEVVCVEYSGAVRSYHVSATEGYQVGHTFSLASDHYRHGITAATLHKSLLVVAGPSQHMSDTKLSYFGLGHGITMWRRLEQHPYYKQVSCLEDDTYEPSSTQSSFLQGLTSRLFRPATPPNTAFTLRVSPDGRHLAALHLSGAVSLWHFPSLRKSKYWQLHDQPESAVTNVPTTKAAAEAHRLLQAAKEDGGQHSPPDLLKPGQPLSLEWWSREDDVGSGATTESSRRGGGEDGLVLCRTNGALTISSINTFTNLLGDNPEFLSGSPMVCEPQRGGFLCLELERRVARRRRHTSSASSTAGALDATTAASGGGPAHQAPDWPQQYDGDEGPNPWEEDGGDGPFGGWDADSGQWVPAASLLPTEGEEGLLLQDGGAEVQGPDLPLEKQPPMGYLAWLLVLFWNFLYWLTDDQRFQVSTVDVIEQQYRLVLFKSSSPEDLFTNKIHSQEYGEALLLARTYDLDTDLVYQEQWLHTSPSLASISDYLSRVRCRDWALQQCLSVVPSTLLPARELLLYGLRGTDLNVLATIGSGDDDGEWLSGPSLFDCEDEQQRRELLHSLAQLEEKVDWKYLTEEQKSLISVRQKLLRYLDRLDTYEFLMGGGQFALERYDPAFYATFREQSSVAACLQFARAADVDAVRIMWTYHGSDTLGHRLAILSNLPPTLGPFEYRALLPACGVDGAVCEWPCAALREEDWCEQLRLVGFLSNRNPAKLLDDICSLYASAPGVTDLCGGLFDAGDFASAVDVSSTEEERGETTRLRGQVQLLSPDVVSRWYQLRARQLEKECGLVDSAYDLLKLGRERNVQGLESLLSSLSTLEVLVYEAGHTHMSLEQLVNLPNTRLLAMLLDKTAGGPSFLHQMKEWVLPYLERCESAEPGSRDTLLAEYLQEQAQNSLQLPRTVFQYVCSCPNLFGCDALYRCAVACVYACKDPGQLDTATALLDELPVTTNTVSLSDLQLLRLQLWCCNVLQRNDVPVLPSALVDIAEEDAAHLYVRMARAKVRKSAELNLASWVELLDDMLELQQKMLQCTTPQHCYRSVAGALLTSGVPQYIEFAVEFFMAEPSPEGRPGAVPTSDAGNPYMEGVEYREAVMLVIDATRGYYNSAEHYKDEALDMAKQCLQLVQVDQEAGLEELLQEERDLITALEILHEFDVDMLPLQVRLCSDRKRLVEAALKSNPTLCLQYWWRLLQLAQLLRILQDDKVARETAVLALVAEQALQMRELEACFGLCERLMALGRSEGWQVCAQLARLDSYEDLAAKERLLDYALTYCPGHMLPELVHFRNSVELAIVCQRAHTQMASEGVPAVEGGMEASSDNEDQFEDAQDESGPDAHSDGGGRGARLLQATLGATHSVSAGASSVLAAVGRRTFWTSAVRWLAPLQGLPLDQLELSSEDNSSFDLQGCHAFFADNCPQAHLSCIGFRYDSYTSPSPPSPALQFSLDLLHAALLQRSLVPQEAHQGEDQEHGKVVAEVSRAVLPEDTAMGVSLLLMLQLPEQARAVLQALPNTDIAIQVRQYYYAVQIYSTLYPWPRPTTAPVFLHDPATVVACAAQIVAKHAEHEDEQQRTAQAGAEHGAPVLGTVSHGAQETPYRRLEKDGVRFYTGDALIDARLIKYYEYFRETEDLLDDFVQGQALHRLDAGVDVKRFLSDASYKEDTVLGLCMTTEKEIMNLAVVLAKKYNVSLWEVHMTQLQYLFISELSTEDLKKDIQERKVLDILKNKPQDFLQRLRSNVLALIDGTDHERLVLFFSLVLSCKADQSSCDEATKHMEVLQELKKMAPRLSYHYLLRTHPDVLDHLGTVVRSNNVSQLATLVEALPRSDEPPPVTRSTVFTAYCIRHFLGLAKDKASGLQQADWLRRYNEVSRHWSELTCADVLVLTRAIVLSDEAFKLVPLGARIAVLDAAVKASVHREGEKAEWLSVSQDLLQWKVHLASLQTSAFESLISGPDLALRRYAKMYGTSGGSPSAVATLCSRVLAEDCDLDTLRELVAVMPDDAAPQPEDTLHEMVQRALDALLLQEGDKPDALLPEHLSHAPLSSQRQWWLARLRHLLTVLGRELRRDNDLLMAELLLEGIRGAVKDGALPKEESIALMRDTCENIPVTDEDKNMMLFLDTCQLVEEASFPVLCVWTTDGGEACSSDRSVAASTFLSFEDIAHTSLTTPLSGMNDHQSKEYLEKESGAVRASVADASSHEGASGRRVTITLASVSEEHRREAFFEELLSVASSEEHTRALLRLLQLWPPFSKQTYESVSGNPWEAVLTRLVAEATPGGERMPGDLIWDTAQRAVGLQQLPSSSLGHLTLELLALGQPAWLLAAKLALCRPNPRAVTAVLQNYTIAGDKVIGADYDDELFSRLVEQRLVPRLIGTPLYEPCCQYLIRAGDNVVLQGVIEQLQQSHPQEAAALHQRVAVARPALASLTTAFRKVYNRLI